MALIYTPFSWVACLMCVFLWEHFLCLFFWPVVYDITVMHSCHKISVQCYFLPVTSWNTYISSTYKWLGKKRPAIGKSLNLTVKRTVGKRVWFIDIDPCISMLRLIIRTSKQLQTLWNKYTLKRNGTEEIHLISQSESGIRKGFKCMSVQATTIKPQHVWPMGKQEQMQASKGREVTQVEVCYYKENELN